jgi:hypothetical protein
VWRSLVAHLHGVQGVEGSNPFTPTTNQYKGLQELRLEGLLLACQVSATYRTGSAAL